MKSCATRRRKSCVGWSALLAAISPGFTGLKYLTLIWPNVWARSKSALWHSKRDRQSRNTLTACSHPPFPSPAGTVRLSSRPASSRDGPTPSPPAHSLRYEWRDSRFRLSWDSKSADTRYAIPRLWWRLHLRILFACGNEAGFLPLQRPGSPTSRVSTIPPAFAMKGT